jgi:hypothetical protein
MWPQVNLIWDKEINNNDVAVTWQFPFSAARKKKNKWGWLLVYVSEGFFFKENERKLCHINIYK